MSENASNTKAAVEKPREASQALRDRGNYWEITYAQNISQFEPWQLEETSLGTETGKTGVTVTADTRAVNLKEKEFKTCDFNHFRLADSTFRDCDFVSCRFVKAEFNNVKFSGCQFDICHFFHVTFNNCQFLDCKFSNISVSATHIVFSGTAISAKAFVNALVTNVRALPNGKTISYQEYRLLADKAKIARAIFISVRNEPELNLMFDANQCFELALQRKRIEDACWKESDGQLQERNPIYRFTIGTSRIAELLLIEVTGFLTDWGRSLMKPLWLLFSALVVFSLVYRFVSGDDSVTAIFRALNCAFVFGYSNYPTGTKAHAIDYIMFVNTLFGLYWYALFIPALSKRLFR